MTALHEQKRKLQDENARLILNWLQSVSVGQQFFIIRSMLKKYSIGELQEMMEHVTCQIADIEATWRDNG